MNEAIFRYVRLEKAAGYSGDWRRAAAISQHVRRACLLYSFAFNPY